MQSIFILLFLLIILLVLIICNIIVLNINFNKKKIYKGGNPYNDLILGIHIDDILLVEKALNEDPNIVNTIIEGRNITFLMFACEQLIINPIIIEMLLNAGNRDRLDEAITIALKNRNVTSDIIKILLNAGAVINYENLINICQNVKINIEIFELLIDNLIVNGANIEDILLHIKDNIEPQKINDIIKKINRFQYWKSRKNIILLRDGLLSFFDSNSGENIRSNNASRVFYNKRFNKNIASFLGDKKIEPITAKTGPPVRIKFAHP